MPPCRGPPPMQKYITSLTTGSVDYCLGLVRKECLGSDTHSTSQTGNDGWSKSPKVSWGSSPPLHIQETTCPKSSKNIVHIPLL